MNRRDLRKPYPFHAAAFDTVPIKRPPTLQRDASQHRRGAYRRAAVLYFLALAALAVAARCFGG